MQEAVFEAEAVCVVEGAENDPDGFVATGFGVHLVELDEAFRIDALFAISASGALDGLLVGS